MGTRPLPRSEPSRGMGELEEGEPGSPPRAWGFVLTPRCGWATTGPAPKPSSPRAAPSGPGARRAGRASPCWPGSGGSSCRAHGSRARSCGAPPRSRRTARLRRLERWGGLVSVVHGGGQAGGAGAGTALTSDHLHVEPQPPQGLLGIEVAFHQLIQCLGEGSHHCPGQVVPLEFVTITQARWPPPHGCSTPRAAHLLAVFHCLSLGVLRLSHLVPPPLRRPVQELLHLPLRKDVGVPEQLVFILIDCAGGGKFTCRHAVCTSSDRLPESITSRPTRPRWRTRAHRGPGPPPPRLTGPVPGTWVLEVAGRQEGVGGQWALSSQLSRPGSQRGQQLAQAGRGTSERGP